MGQMSPIWRSSLRSKGFKPHIRHPALGPCIGKMSLPNIWFWKSAGLNSRRTETLLKGPVHKHSHSEIQHRGRTLKSSWATCEGDLSTHFMASAKGAESCKNFLCWWKCSQAPFSLFSFYLPGLAPMGDISHTPHLPYYHYSPYPGVPLWICPAQFTHSKVTPTLPHPIDSLSQDKCPLPKTLPPSTPSGNLPHQSNSHPWRGAALPTSVPAIVRAGLCSQPHQGPAPPIRAPSALINEIESRKQ